MLYVFAVRLHWLPMGGYGTAAHLVLPVLTLGVLGAGWYSRMMRSNMVEVLRRDFIRTARAKGLPRARVGPAQRGSARHRHDRHRRRHLHGRHRGRGVGVRLALTGQLAPQAIPRVDIPIILGVMLVSAVFITLGNLKADLVAPLIDPRIRLRRIVNGSLTDRALRQETRNRPL